MSDDREAQMEQQLVELLEVPQFEPSPEFRKQALVSDDSLTERADADRLGYCRKQVHSLDWAVEPSVVSRRLQPALLHVVHRRRINASYNCLDRHVEAGRGDGIAFHWHGEEGVTREVTYADLLRDVQRLANALEDRGVSKGDVVGSYLPIIPEVVVAMLA
jgi:acetyl-CoA synthetase